MLHDSERPLAEITFLRVFSQLRPGELIGGFLQPLGHLRGEAAPPPDDWLPDRVLTQLEWDRRLKSSAAEVKAALEKQYVADRRAFLARVGSVDRLAEILDDEAHSQSGPAHRRYCHGYSVEPGTGERLLAVPMLRYSFQRVEDYWVAQPPNLDKIAAQVLAQPDGQRFLRSFDFHYVFPERIFTERQSPTHEDGYVWDGQCAETPPHLGRKFPGIFFARWRRSIAPIWRAFFHGLKERGVALNGLLLDWEKQLSFHYINEQRDESGRAGIFGWLRSHPDWPPIAKKYGLDLVGAEKWRADRPQGQRFTEAMHVHQAEQMGVLYETVKEVFGEALWLFSNYNHFYKCATYQSGGDRTYCHSPVGCGATLGNFQSVPAYNSINSSWRPGLPVKPMQAPSYGVGLTGSRDGSSWDRFLFDQFTLRRIAAASRQPSAPYFANLEYAVKAGAPPEEQALWYEQIRCAACLGGDPMLFWDRSRNQSAQTNNGWEQVLAEIESVFLAQQGVPRTPEHITWAERIAVTCTIDVAGQLVTRFVPNPAERAAFHRQEAEGRLTLLHRPSGRRWDFSRGKIVTIEPAEAGGAPAPGVGWWIVQTNRPLAERDLWLAECRAAAWQILMPGAPR